MQRFGYLPPDRCSSNRARVKGWMKLSQRIPRISRLKVEVCDLLHLKERLTTGLGRRCCRGSVAVAIGCFWHELLEAALRLNRKKGNFQTDLNYVSRTQRYA